MDEYITWVETCENEKDEAPFTDIVDGLRKLKATLESTGQEVTFVALHADPMYFLRYDLVSSSPTTHGPALPSNFAVLGDAIIRLNPVFGQGTSKAMADAVSLDEALRRLPAKKGVLPGFSRKVFKAQLSRSVPMWDLTRWEGKLLI